MSRLKMNKDERLRRRREQYHKNKHNWPSRYRDRGDYHKIWYARNKDRVAILRETRRSNPDAQRRDYLKRLHYKYGITVEAYETLLTAQNGLCAICGQVNPNKSELAVDHDHTTNKVRGLLCSTCNTGIGHLKDSTELVRRAFNYLAKYAEPVL